MVFGVVEPRTIMTFVTNSDQAFVQARIRRGKYAEIGKQAKTIIFLGTPLRGSSFSSFGRVIANALRPLGSNPSILEELAYDSLFLQDLHHNFASLSNDLQVVNFFEKRKTRLFKAWVVQWDEYESQTR